MKMIILNGSTDEIHIKDVDADRPIFVKEDGKLIGMVSKHPFSPFCGFYGGMDNTVDSHSHLHDFIQNCSQRGYTFHVED